MNAEVEELQRQLDAERQKLFKICTDLAERDMALLNATDKVREELAAARAEVKDLQSRLARSEQTVAALRASTSRRVARRFKRMVSSKPA